MTARAARHHLNATASAAYAERRGPTMADILFIAVTIASFVALAAFVYACDRI